MKEIKAVVVHWDAGTVKTIKALKKWMTEETDHMYHRFVKGSEVDYGKSTKERVTAVGAPQYTEEAIKYFGHYCPSWKHTHKTPHLNSPNNCTVNICMLHDYEDGGYSEETLLSAARLCADMLSYYNLGLDGLWTHSMICGESYKHCPKEFVEKPEQWQIFRNMVKHYL